jgi:SAM-dependent methyltransferase
MIDWGAFTDAEVLAFTETIIGVAREMAREVPAPRGAPLFGLDMPVADPSWLDRFSRHGIFRKYQRAIAFDSGLGGVPRWWAVHFGCSVDAIDPLPAPSQAAQVLRSASAVGKRATFRSAPLHSLPSRAEQFTHAWSIENLAALADPAPVLHEAMRVLRPSGMLSAVLSGDSEADAPVERWANAVDAAGFIAIAVRRFPTPELPFTVFHAAHVLRATLAAAFSGERRERLLDLAGQLDVARNDRRPRVIVFAEKPS